MYRSIESVLLTEFIIDVAVLWAALRGKHRLRPMRLVAAGITGAMASCIAVLTSARAVYIASAAVAVPAMLFICTGAVRQTGLMGSIASILTVSALIAAAADILQGIPPVFAALPAASAAAFAAASRRRWLDTWDAALDIGLSGRRASVDALIDTGNRLIEPISGLPVIVAEEGALTALLPEGYAAGGMDQAGFRRIAYGGVGGDGTLLCFMPDSISAEGQPIYGIWIAVYPGKLPGKYHALAPAAVMDILSKKTKRRTIKWPAHDL